MASIKDIALLKKLFKEIRIGYPGDSCYISMRELFSKYLTLDKVAYYDPLFPTENIPLRYFEGNIQYYSSATNTWVTVTALPTSCPVLSPDSGNIAECRENGLYVPTCDCGTSQDLPPAHEFEVLTIGSLFSEGDSSVTISGYAGFNILFFRNNIKQSKINTGGTYYNWNSTTGTLTLYGGNAMEGELFDIYPLEGIGTQNTYSFIVSGASFITVGQTSKVISSFIGSDIIFFRNSLKEPNINTGGTYYSWDKNTGTLNILGGAPVGGELLEIIKI